MIVTRRRRKPFPWKRLALPVVAIALVAFALSWTPSRNAIGNGPAAPLWRATGATLGGIAAPFHFTAQNQELGNRAKEIAQLQSQVADMQAKDQAKDKKVADLQGQIATLQSQAAAARGTVAPHSAQAPSTNDAFASNMNAPVRGGDLSAGATPDMHRTAEYWASMEPENAAKVVQKLPTVYVARIFALMSSDAVGSVMDALPPSYVAQLTQEHPELKR